MNWHSFIIIRRPWSSIFLMESTNGPVALTTHLALVVHSSPVTSSRILAPHVFPSASFTRPVTLGGDSID